MAIDKIEVKVLAVGQGSCNVVRGINTSAPDGKKLEYLAILDAGGDSVSKNPALETKNKLEEYMKERATAMDKAPTDHFADLLLISHSDDDHYSIIKSICKTKKETTISNPAKDVIRSKKVKVNTKRVLKESNFIYPDERYFAFSVFESALYLSGSPQDNYAYIHKANTPLGNFFLLKSYYIKNSIVKDCIFNASLDAKYWKQEIILRCYDSYPNQVDLLYNYNGTDNVLGLNMGTKYANATIIKEGNRIIIKYYSKDEEQTIKFEDPGFTFDFLKILEALKKIPQWYDIFPYYFHIRDYILNVAPVYFAEIPNPDITFEEIFRELNVSQVDNDKSASNDNTISFGKVVTSISKDNPAVIEYLADHAVPGIYIDTVPKFYINFLETPGSATRDVVVKWLKRLKYYDTKYKETKGSKLSSDGNFRNMNSIITIVGLIENGPHFIFPGDATVQNMWYNINERGEFFEKGAGSNFLTLPHHGSYKTSFGQPRAATKSVFSEFLEKINPKVIYISAGLNNHHGHPNIWTLERCNEFLIPKPVCPNHFIYTNTVNTSHAAFDFFNYNRALYTTVSSEARGIVAPSYYINFDALGTEDGQIPNPPIVGINKEGNLKILNEFSNTTESTITNHPIFDFVFEE